MSNKDSKPLLGSERNQKLKIKEEEDGCCNSKSIAFLTIGILTLIYVIVELAAALWVDSLTLLSDGFHNLSDVVSLYIAWWAQKAAKRDSDNNMSYGWARTELIGGLTNGCFLLSLSLYVALEAIPKMIRPSPMEGGVIFMSVAGAGLAINILGTIVFAATGMAHAHSHGGGGGHSHGGGGHSHGGESKKKDKKKLEKGSAELEKPKEKHGHSHDHGHSHGSSGDHGHSHGSASNDHDDHGHSHGGASKKKKEKHGHSHGGHDDHGHGGAKKKKGFLGMDVNMFGVFIHFLGDAISSLFVLITGVIIQYTHGKWTEYIDPVSSLIIVAIIVASSVPLVKRCSLILLQQVPEGIDMDRIRSKLLKIEGVLSQHDLHVWQLVDGMVIASVHVGVEEGSDFPSIASEIKRIFHHQGIHSTSIQPEFIHRNVNKDYEFCAQNCIKECDEEWCCKKTADRIRERNLIYSTNYDV
eukprot:gene6169-7683_t